MRRLEFIILLMSLAWASPASAAFLGFEGGPCRLASADHVGFCYGFRMGFDLGPVTDGEPAWWLGPYFERVSRTDAPLGYGELKRTATDLGLEVTRAERMLDPHLRVFLRLGIADSTGARGSTGYPITGSDQVEVGFGARYVWQLGPRFSLGPEAQFLTTGEDSGGNRGKVLIALMF